MSGSDAERALLTQIQWAGLPTPEAEYAFAKGIGRRWRFDFAWPAHKLAIEVDGGSWIAGRHTSGAGFAADCEKLNEAAILGYRCLRFTPEMVESGVALATIERALGVMVVVGETRE
jgi:hypothetical protein